MVSFFGTFLTPFVIHRLGRNATYVIGILCCMIGMAGLATSTIPGLGLGMLGRALSGVIGSVCLILFIVDFIPRANLVRSETLRLFTSCIAWGFGPVIGVGSMSDTASSRRRRSRSPSISASSSISGA